MIRWNWMLLSSGKLQNINEKFQNISEKLKTSAKNFKKVKNFKVIPLASNNFQVIVWI